VSIFEKTEPFINPRPDIICKEGAVVKKKQMPSSGLACLCEKTFFKKIK
jgi:hypothetical protein